MTQDEKREVIIQHTVGLMRENPFSFEFKVKKNPKGLKIIYELTQEELDALMAERLNDVE
jgi:hypothetical protein